jgi:hypothetical protein
LFSLWVSFSIRSVFFRAVNTGVKQIVHLLFRHAGRRNLAFTVEQWMEEVRLREKPA